MNNKLLLKERIGAGNCVAGHERSMDKTEADNMQKPLFGFYIW